MPPDRTRAFLSYSRRDREWVETFYRHLNELTSVNGRVDLFWDDDIEPSKTWNTLLEAEVDAASSMVLIATPEALASADVQKERNQFAQRTKNQRLYVVRRVAIDLPQAWMAPQLLECTEPSHYATTLRKLAAALRGVKETTVDLPAGLTNDGWERPTRLDLALWKRLVKLLRDTLDTSAPRPLTLAGLTDFLDLPKRWHEPFPSTYEQANACAVLFLKQSEPHAGAVALLDALDDKLITKDQHDLHRELYDLRRLLARPAPALPPPPQPVATTASPTDTFEAQLVRYRQAMLAQCGTIEFFGFESAVQVPIRMEQLWVELQVAIHERGKERSFDNAKEADAELRATERVRTLQQAMNFARQRNQRGVVILGDPGSGKTTLLRRTVCEAIARPRDFALNAEVIPVLLRMRELQANDLQAGLDTFCQRALPKHAGLPADFGRHVYNRPLLLLVDGLDEVAEAQRTATVQWLGECLRQRDDFTFLVTCRYAGYTERARFDQHFLELHLRPFRQEQIHTFVTQWYSAVETSLQPDTGPVRAEEAAKDLIGRLDKQTRASNRMLEMAANPLLLTNICLVHRSRSRYLPEARHRLYDECLNVLLEHWRAGKDLRADLDKRALQPVALFMHERNEAITPGKDLEAPLAKGLRDAGLPADPRAFLLRARNDAGVLTGWSGDRFGFMHLGFQEYLAAKEIARRTVSAALKRTTSPDLEALAKQFANPWWQEVILLLLASEESLCEPLFTELLKQPMLGAHPSMWEDCVRAAAGRDPAPFVAFLEQNLPARPDTGWWHKLVGAAGLREEAEARVRAALHALRLFAPAAMQSFSARMPADLRGGGPDATSRQSDGGIEVHGLRLEPIPAGEFWMGDEQGDTDEKPRHRVRVPAFHLAATPVTNAQYRRFVEATGARSPDCWSNRQFNADDQPVVNVSWEDVTAYCKWGRLALPSEAMWEYACRAGTETRFWSGNSDDDLARVGWYSANSGSRTHAVGEGPANIFGLFDVHGNVWEWCEDTYQESYQAAPTDGSAWVVRGVRFRALRGGSWLDDAGWCRASARIRRSASDRPDYAGFRPARFATS